MIPKIGSKMRMCNDEWYNHKKGEEGVVISTPTDYSSLNWVFFKINNCPDTRHNRMGYCGGAHYQQYVDVIFEFGERQPFQQTQKQSCVCPSFQLTWEGHNPGCPEKRTK